MALGLVGKKSGMTRIFNEEGVSVPVTVIEAEPNRITQVKSVESDGLQRTAQRTGGPPGGVSSRRDSQIDRDWP